MKHATLAERFEEKYSPEPNTGCWLWHGATIKDGYGKMNVYGKFIAAHRVSYMLHKGEIPDGAVLDHLCRTPCCVNPSHLEAVSVRENVRRGLAPVVTKARHRAKTTCKRGHSLTDLMNVRFAYSRGVAQRVCKTCMRMHQASYKARGVQ